MRLLCFCLVLHINLTLPLRQSLRTSQTLTSSKRRKFKKLSCSSRVGLLKLVNMNEVREGQERRGSMGLILHRAEKPSGAAGGTGTSRGKANFLQARPAFGEKGWSEPFGEGDLGPAGVGTSLRASCKPSCAPGAFEKSLFKKCAGAAAAAGEQAAAPHSAACQKPWLCRSLRFFLDPNASAF